MSEAFIGEIRLFPYQQVPRGWAVCKGQELSIASNQALFAILGNVYGGNGSTTFALPNLVGRTPVHVGEGVTLGELAGEEEHTLSVNEMPTHVHEVRASNDDASNPIPENRAWAKTGNTLAYSTEAPNTTLSSNAIASFGGNKPHENRQPYLVLQYCIAVYGIFPSRN
jgi:microcystin-dependent protein